MYTESLRKTFKMYFDFLSGMKVKRKNYPKDELLHVELKKVLSDCAEESFLSHTNSLWFAGNISDLKKYPIASTLRRAYRKLGFIQGCLWCCGLYTRDELDNHYKEGDSDLGEGLFFNLPRIMRWDNYQDAMKFSALIEHLIPSIRFEELDLDFEIFEDEEDYQDFYFLYYVFDKPNIEDIKKMVNDQKKVKKLLT